MIADLESYDSSLYPVNRQALAALALVHGVRYAEKLSLEKENGCDIRLYYPLGVDELRQCFALLKLRQILEKPLNEVVDRRKRCEAERALAAAREAAPRPMIIVRSIAKVEYTIQILLQVLECTKKSNNNDRLRDEKAFTFEVAKEASILSPIGYLRKESVVVFDWHDEGTLARRMAIQKRVWERELELWATGLAAGLVATHQAGYALNGPGQNEVVLARDGFWIEDQVHYLEQMDKYIKYNQITHNLKCKTSGEDNDDDSTEENSSKSSSDSKSDDDGTETDRAFHLLTSSPKKIKQLTPEQHVAALIGEGARPVPPLPRFIALLSDYTHCSPLGQAASRALPYTPPEARGKDGGSKAADIWCLGMLLWQLAGARKPMPAVPDRFSPNVALAIRLALDPDPERRASAEEIFYVLKPDRAKRRHSVLPLRQHIAKALGLGDGGYMNEVPPLRESTRKRDALLGYENKDHFLYYAGGTDMSADEVSLTKLDYSSKKLIQSKNGNAFLHEDDDTSEQQQQNDSALRRLEASLSPKALEGWRKCLDRVRRYQKKLHWQNLPGVKKARIKRRRAAEQARVARAKRIEASRRCALLVFWGEQEVATWARMSARRAVDALILKIGQPTAVYTKNTKPKKCQQEEPLCPNEIMTIFSRLRRARSSGEDARRRARRTVAQGVATRDKKIEAAAAEAAIELVKLDKIARRCCEALAKALAHINGAALRYALNRAETEAESGLIALRLANAAKDAEDQRIARTGFAVGALADDASGLRDRLREAARKIEGSSKKKVPERTAWILATILYESILATLGDGEEARQDAAAKVQAQIRGQRTRHIMTEVWRQAELDTMDELRAASAARQANQAIGAREKERAPSAPFLLLADSKPRQVCIRLAPYLIAPLSEAKRPLSLQGWLTPASNIILLELGQAEVDYGSNKSSQTEAIVNNLLPATIYTAQLRLLPSARSVLRLTSAKTDNQRPIRFRTPPDAPENVAPPSLAVVRLRASAAALLGDDANDREFTTAVRICWQAPRANGISVRHYLCERARGSMDKHEPPTAWLRLKTVCANEMIDLPPLDHSHVWWYRVAASNRVGRGGFSIPVRVDATPEIADQAPIYDPQPLALLADDDCDDLFDEAQFTKPAVDENLNNGVLQSKLQHNVYFKTLQVKSPLPASTMTTTFLR